jgi:asparagine N-glycosylation enzyme membrane subunit Stt3
MKSPLFKQTGTLALLLCILFLTFWIRIQGAERFPDGQFAGNDAYLYYWQTQIIEEQGALPERDMHRWLPDGRDNLQLLSLYPYAIAYTHKLLPWVSLYDIQLYFPVICFTLGLGVFFLFFARTHGLLFASIIALLLATLPGSIERSAAGFGDRDAWCWMFGVLAITSYLWKEQIEPGRRRYLATAFSGCIVFLGGMSWEGFGFFLLIILSVEIWKFCTTDTEQHLKEYLLYILMFVPGLYLISPAYRSGYGFSTHIAALTLLPPLVLLGLRGIRYLLILYVKSVSAHARKLAWGLTLLAVATGIYYIFSQADTFANTAFPFRESRLMADIGELADPKFGYWKHRYGAVFVLGSIGFIIGSLQLWKWEGIPLAVSLSIFVGTTFFREPTNNLIGADLCNTLFFTALIMMLIAMGIASLRHETSKNEQVMLTMLAWFLLWVGLARGGKRYDFFIGVPLAYSTASLLCSLPVLLIQKLKDAKILYHHINGQRITACFAVVMLLFVGFWNPLGGHVNRAVHAAANMQKPSPGKDANLTQTLAWMKNTLPKNAVVAANWGYGTQLNILAGVKTITDSDHFLPHWVHLYYRHVFCAQNEKEALEFLKTHGATHLMLTKHGVTSQSKNFSFIGSNENEDRRFRFYELESTKTPIGAPYQIRSKWSITPFAFIDMVSTTPVRSPGSHSHIIPGTQQKIGVTVHLKTHRNIFQEISVNADKPSLQAVDSENGGIILYFDSKATLEKAHYVPVLGWKSLAVKLFLRQKHSTAFVPAYPTDSDSTAEVKVWEIHYPPDIQPNPKYLATTP